MAQRKDKERELAKALFIETDKTQKEIAALVAVTEKTMTGWVAAGKWDVLRAGRMATTTQTVATLQTMLQLRSEEMLADMRGGGTTKFGDELLKISMTIEKLQGATSITTYIQVCQEFMGFVGSKEPQFRGKLADYQSQFLNLKAGSNGK
ncbi:phage terminase small subunit-related protein [Hymenobacter rubripertinctus]|uniref:PBSX phage terminase small subunit-like N-terminal domain-containing protein n=1 Tax=Hymenobacter rubripertinctus TaxID=2029981 RepID=A0A418QN15_9BACT|nr:phage terminase small subunit-related protein [Hymenobacter rubripertinctus]RIY06470.1 hypothetical protein D0T11_18695 [Hymenobacter rubripertinctus]